MIIATRNWTAITILAAMLVANPASGTTSADEVATRAYEVNRFTGSQADIAFEVTTKSGNTRRIAAKTWTKLSPNGENMRLAKFTAPADLVGTATLSVENHQGDDDIWIHLPALGKVRRMLASSKKDSYLGTDFTFGDVIGYRPDQWTHRLLEGQVVDGVACRVLESVGSESAAKQSGFSRRVSWVREDNYVTVKGEAYDLAGRLAKTYSATALEEPAKGSRQWQAMRIEARSVDSGRRTVLTLSGFQVNPGLDNELFSPGSLEDTGSAP